MDVFLDEFRNSRCRFRKSHVITSDFFNSWCEKCAPDGKCIIMCAIAFLTWSCVRNISYNKTTWTNLKCPAVWGMRLLNVHYDEICDVGKIANNFAELVQFRQKWSSACAAKIYDQGASTLWRFQQTKALLAIHGNQGRVVSLGTEFCLLVYVQKNESPQSF